MALPKDLHIVVCTPCFGGLVTQGYMLSTTNLLLLGSQMGVNVSVELLGYDSLITRSRNSLVARFMDRPDATHLMFVDADITFQPAQIFRMAAFDKDIVAGMYPLKVRDWSAEAVARAQAGEPLETAPLRYVGLPCDEAARQEAVGFVTGEYAGTGFMLIGRATLQRMMAAYPELRFAAAHDRAQQDPSPHQYALFDCMIEPETRHYLSEDYTFCRRWRDIGGEIWLDTQGALVHTGSQDFVGNVARRYPLKESMFFSEEKNQKTFDSAPAERSRPWPESGELRKK
jgi:hypothetical protein